MVIVFHREDLFLCVLVVFVPHPVLVILQEEPGSFFIKSFQVVEDSNKFLLKLLTASLSIPCAVILSSHSLSSSPSLMSFSWARPRMSANVVLPACATHRAVSGDFYCSSSDTPGMPELWAMLATSRHLHTFVSWSPNKSALVISVVCSFTSLQRTGFEGLRVAGRVFLFNVVVKYLRF